MQRSGLRPEPTDQVLGDLNGQSIARRLAAAARSAGIERADHRALRARRPRFRTHRPWGQHHRDDACRRLENHYCAAATAEQGAVAKYL